jgi:hypothetical protein
LLSAGNEWSQHRKIIETDRDKKGKKDFRKSMIKNLPYFHVWFDPNRGYGHIIEDAETEAETGDTGGMESLGSSGNAKWPVWFGKEVLAGPLDSSPEYWRRPRVVGLDDKDVVGNVKAFKENWKPFDWTAMLD